MNNLTSTDWLHPVPLFIITVLLPYIIYAVINPLPFDALLLYFSFIVIFLLPFFLIPYKEVHFTAEGDGKTRIFQTIILTGLFGIILFFRLLNYSSIMYAELATGTPSWVFWSSIISWLTCFRLIATESIHKRICIPFCLIALEMGLLILMGQRLWLVMFVFGLFAAIHVYIKKLHFKWIAAGILGFVLVAGPLMVISRYSIQDEHPFVEVFWHELSYYPDKIGDTLDRVGGKGLVLADLSKSLLGGSYHRKKRDPDELWQDIATASVPNIFKNKKHNIRPGTDVYETFITQKNPSNITYPSGLIGDIVWHFGWWAYLILPSLSLFLITIWNNVLANLCARYEVTAIHFSYFFVLYDTHLVFFFTAWTRAVFVYGMFIIMLITVNKLEIFWARRKI